jgi:hypothetical protein
LILLINKENIICHLKKDALKTEAALIEVQERCTKQFAPSAALNAKYHSSQQRASLSFVESVSQRKHPEDSNFD